MGLGILSHAPSSLPNPPMSDTGSDLGTCPYCGSVIPIRAILVEYNVNGETRLFAECYECDEPVQPQ